MKRLPPVTIGILVVAAAMIVFMLTPRPPSASVRAGSASEAQGSSATSSALDIKSQSSPESTAKDEVSNGATIRGAVQDVVRSQDLPAGLRVRLLDDAAHPVAGASIWVIRVQPYEFPPRREIDSVALCDQLAVREPLILRVRGRQVLRTSLT